MTTPDQYRELASPALEQAACQTLPQRRRQFEETAARWTEMAVWSEGHTQRVVVTGRAAR